MSSFLPARLWGFAACVLLFVLCCVGLLWNEAWEWGALVFGVLVAVGVYDLVQRRHAVSRNYPVLAHFRYFLESIGPEIRQYFIERDTEENPFSRLQRSIVYQRAKGERDTRPFGTQIDVYSNDHEWINHSVSPAAIDSHDFRIVIGPDRAQPYSASVFNISAMSFGSLSGNAIRALNGGAKMGSFYHDTGEGSISVHHRANGGDLTWEVASGYFGCRNPDGTFSEEKFIAAARDPQVKMIEIKLSQGAKPGHGGVLPAAKVSAEIAEARGVPMGVDCISPAKHSAFSTPIGLLQFVERLRELSGGKPTGFKLAIGHPWEWFGIAKAMQQTGILPDFIVVDGGEGGTGAAPAEFVDHVGVPLREALLLVHNTLVGLNLRGNIRIGAAGKITSAYELARILALGADWANAARGFMFALGCIQSQNCHTDRCPTGVATQDPKRQQALDVDTKAMRVFRFHQNTLRALKELLAAAGLSHPQELGPEHIISRVSPTEVRSFAALYNYLEPGSLLMGAPEHAVFDEFWEVSSADAFAPPSSIAALRGSKLV
ncbi:MAG TPA: FMN-binding glutamate synthase family protein [Xanthomonadaceae bacterium]|jgi:glutamate synthase domain-containing protein 2|nr:FMN-binding glutamate synthase family protein [Xanthomonadaceae bacterium]